MRHILIDTSAALAESIALVMALREPDVKVVAVTTLAGKVSNQEATRNALLAIRAADSYTPAVYKGISKPMFHKIPQIAPVDSKNGEEQQLDTEKIHAVDAIIHTVSQNQEEVELLALGPLTNIALSVIKAPEIMKRINRIIILGGSAFEGNVSPMAEFNIWQDAEAADIVFDFGVPIVMVAMEAFNQDCGLVPEDLALLARSESKYAKFCIDCINAIQKNEERTEGIQSPILPAAIAFALMAKPHLIVDSFPSYTRVETMGGPQVYGTTLNDKRTPETHPFRARNNETLPDFNCQVVTKFDCKDFKEYFLGLLA